MTTVLRRQGGVGCYGPFYASFASKSASEPAR